MVAKSGKREQIIKAATAVFIEKGYAGASLSEITSRFGGSKSTLYSYFKSKEELFIAVMEAMALNTAKPLIEDLGQGRNVKKALENFVYEVMKLLCTKEMIEFRRMLISEGGRTQIGKKIHELEGKKYMEKFAEFYAENMRAGRFIKADPFESAMHMYSLCYGYPVQMVMVGVTQSVSDADLKKAAQSVTKFFLRAYMVH